LHVDTSPGYLSCDNKKTEVQRYQMFFGTFNVASRVTSVAWADTIPSKHFRFYCSKLKCFSFNFPSPAGSNCPFYPRVYVVYRRVYILLCCCSCSCCCSWEAFNQTWQYIGWQLIKHDQTWSDMIRNLIRNLIRHNQTWSDMIRHDQTWSDMIRHD
jgi:hypothetical protein